MATQKITIVPSAHSTAPFDSFLHYKRVELGLSHRTLENYGRILSNFCAWLTQRKGKSAVEACGDDVREFLADCAERRPNPSSTAQSISVLREFFKHLQRDQIISGDPMRRVESPKQWKRVPKAISESDVRKLLDTSDEGRPALAMRDRAICEILYSAGIRRDELIGAKLTDLNLIERSLVVFGKGSKQRIVPFGLPAARAIRAYLDHVRPVLARAGGRVYQRKDSPYWQITYSVAGQKIFKSTGIPVDETGSRKRAVDELEKIMQNAKQSPFLFLGQGGGPLTGQRVWQIIVACGQRARLPSHVSPHVLRHSCATHMLDHRAGLRSIQIILGHAEISTTQIYTKVSQENLRDALLRYHPRSTPARTQMHLFEAPKPVLIPGPALCVQCQNPAVDGRTLCQEHARKAAEARKRYHEAKLTRR
jgi:integrase/recombinase XerD